jgi:hypothetical protein
MSGRGPDMGSFQLYFGKVVAVDHPDAWSSRSDAPQCLEDSEHVSVFLSEHFAQISD